MYQIVPKVQNYAWGKIGHNSVISQFHFDIENNKPYAELWMGTHKKAESLAIVNNEKIPLSEHIKTELPFLFKVLSINKALSIQVHPDKKMAEELHKDRPEIYLDDNHKPEMFYTLSNFEALCGFRENHEIWTLMTTFSREFRKIVDGSLYIKDDNDLKRIFSKIMKADKNLVKSVIQEIILNIGELKNPEFEKLIIRINAQYPFDVGVLSLFFLNYIQLPKGKVVYLKANVPHAYISGDCLEIMATSDNVIRCGLTPKFRDVNLLCEILDYGYKMPKLVESESEDAGIYEPVNDFGLSIVDVEKVKGIKIDTHYPIIMLALETDKKSFCNDKHIVQGCSYVLTEREIRLNGKCKVVFAYKPSLIPLPPSNTPSQILS